MKIQHFRERGQALLILALALIGLLGFAALAIDGGMLYSDRRMAQTAADAAALAGAAKAAQSLDSQGIDYDRFTACGIAAITTARSNAITGAITRAGLNQFTIAAPMTAESGVETSCNIENHETFDDKYIDVHVRVTYTTPTAFVQLVYPQGVKNTVEAVARVRPRANAIIGQGITSLHHPCENQSSGAGGMKYNSGKVKVEGGGVFSNSCIVYDGNSEIESGSISYIESQKPNPPDPTKIKPNPRQVSTRVTAYGIPKPACPTGTATSHSGAGTIDPGLYSSIELKHAGDTLTMNPGLYCIDAPGGSEKGIDISKGNLIGNGVTIYFIKGDLIVTGGNITLHAPLDDSHNGIPGLLIYLAADSGGNIKMTGNGSSDWVGTVYAPAGDVEVLGTNSVTSSFHTQIIADTVQVGGAGDVVIYFDDEDNYKHAPLLELYR